MKTYMVTIPIAGHAFIEVEAENADDAIEKGLENVVRDHIEEWEPLEQFHHGNICYCPRPWEAEAELALGEEPDEDDDDAA